MKPRYTLKISDYFQQEKPDYQKIGEKIDDLLKKKFPGKKIAVRYLSLQDHPNMSIDELVKTIEETGTDKYDSERRMSVAHDFYVEKGVEMFAVGTTANEEMAITPEVLEDFNEGALHDRGYTLKIDLAVVYDLKQLEVIPIQYDDGVGEDAFKFKSPEKRADAVLGFVVLEGR